MYATDEFSFATVLLRRYGSMKAARRISLFRFRNIESGRCSLASGLPNYFESHILAVEDLAR